MLHTFLRPEPGADLPVAEESWRGYEHVNVQAGLDAWLREPGRTHEIVGLVGFQHRQFGIADLLSGSQEQADPYGLKRGNVAWVNLPTGPGGQTRPCVKCALYLVSEGEHRLALLLRGADPDSGTNTTSLQLASTNEELAASAAAAIRELSVEHNVFRGQVLSFGSEMFGHGQTLMQFHERPVLNAADVILPEQVASAVQRQVVEVARHKGQLLAAGQHLKRGLLLYGPPGVGLSLIHI